MRKTHGLTGSQLYHVWHQMIRRCRNPRHKDYRFYGGRGIDVCERWLSFENFLSDMGARPDGATLDRVNNDGHYEATNCRWTNRKEQARNTRRNVTVVYDGREMCISEACELSGLRVQTVFNRIYRGWPNVHLFIGPTNRWHSPVAGRP